MIRLLVHAKIRHVLTGTPCAEYIAVASTYSPCFNGIALRLPNHARCNRDSGSLPMPGNVRYSTGLL